MFMGFMAKAVMGFLMPALTAGVMSAIGGVGITGDMTVKTIITSFLTGLAVFIVPNAKKM